MKAIGNTALNGSIWLINGANHIDILSNWIENNTGGFAHLQPNILTQSTPLTFSISDTPFLNNFGY